MHLNKFTPRQYHGGGHTLTTTDLSVRCVCRPMRFGIDETNPAALAPLRAF